MVLDLQGLDGLKLAKTSRPDGSLSYNNTQPFCFFRFPGLAQTVKCSPNRNQIQNQYLPILLTKKSAFIWAYL